MRGIECVHPAAPETAGSALGEVVVSMVRSSGSLSNDAAYGALFRFPQAEVARRVSVPEVPRTRCSRFRGLLPGTGEFAEERHRYRGETEYVIAPNLPGNS